jgi:hypothetical protein
MPARTRVSSDSASNGIALGLIVAALVRAVREAAAISEGEVALDSLRVRSCEVELAFLVERTDPQTGEQFVILDRSQLIEANEVAIQRMRVQLSLSGTQVERSRHS